MLLITGLLLFLLATGIYLLFRNHAFKYYFKFGSYYGLYMLIALLYIPWFMIKPKNVTNLRIYHGLTRSSYCHRPTPTHGNGAITKSQHGGRALRAVGRAYNLVSRMFGMHMYVRGQEHLETDKAAIIMANHQASIDIMAMMMMLPERSSALAKKELLYMSGPFGLGAWLCGLVFIDRNNKKSARKTMDKAVKRIQDERIKLWIYPEGTRYLGETFLPFKKGGFHIAVQAQAPIIPVVTSSYRHFLCTKRKIFNEGKVIATVLPPVPTEGLTTEDVDELMERVRDQMLKVHRETSWDVLQEAERQGVSILPPLQEKDNPYNEVDNKDNKEPAEVETVSADNTKEE